MSLFTSTSTARRWGSRALASLTALALAGGCLSACGGLPADAVAQVEGSAITTATLGHWMRIAAAATGASEGSAAVPVPPLYTACIAKLAASQPAKPTKAQPSLTHAQMKTQCAQRYTALVNSALGYLITADWVIGEADAQRIAVSDRQVHAQLVKLRKGSFANAAAFEAFLRRSHWTVSDLLLRVKVEMLSERLQRKVLAPARHVSSAQVAHYYRANKSRFAHQSLSAATPAIRSQLIATQEQQRIATFRTAYQRRWRARTNCRTGYVVSVCRGFKAAKTATGG